MKLHLSFAFSSGLSDTSSASLSTWRWFLLHIHVIQYPVDNSHFHEVLASFQLTSAFSPVHYCFSDKEKIGKRHPFIYPNWQNHFSFRVNGDGSAELDVDIWPKIHCIKRLLGYFFFWFSWGFFSLRNSCYLLMT